ncbi:MAG TPA: amidohydrolase family protein [Acidobacteriota bacterium]|nr:amidohydrolase family protein [Acidobacteriota bacterium]
MKTFIDSHVHIQPWSMMKPEIRERMSRSRPDMEVIRSVMDSPVDFLRHMDREGVEKAALINYVSPHIMGFTDEVNEFVSRFCSQDTNRLLAFGSIDPRRKNGLEARIDELLFKLALRGIKIHPSHQTVYPNDYVNGNDSLAYLYKRCEEKGVPVMFHTGTSIFVGARNRFADPIYVDDVAVDFPKLKIILAHGGRPLWMQTCHFLIRRFPNVNIDISSVPPSKVLEYFPWLEEFADKVLFGTDWPAPMVKGMRENFEIFDRVAISAEAREKMTRTNALKLFGFTS